LIYLDASVVFSLYCADQSTAFAVPLILAARGPLLLSSLCEFEVVNAFSLCVFRKDFTTPEALRARRKLELNIDSGAYINLPLPESTFRRARVLSETITPVVGVRAADLLHIAAALEFGASSFFTFDRRQSAAAHAAGLKVNPLPGSYPQP